MKKESFLSNICFWSFMTLVAVWPALYNQFPLVTPDSGAYIHSGIRMSLGIDRPWGYGLFLLLTSWGITLWTPILVQGALFSWLVYELCKKITGNNVSRPLTALIVLLVSFGTSAAWFNSQLMADAFTGLLLIAILLLYLGEDNKKKVYFLNILIMGTLLMHSAHVIVTLILSVVVFFYFRRRGLPLYVKVSRKLFALSVSAFLLTSLIYAIGGYGFRFSPVSHMFLMSRMAENGILDQYLDEHCPVEHYSLCDFKGQTGDRQWVFMWMGNYPHTKENGWIATRKEYNDIIYGSLKSPKYLGLHILKNTEAGLRQLGQLYVGDGIDQKNPEGSSPYTHIDRNFHHELKEFRSSVQNTAQLPFASSNIIIIAFAVIAGAGVLYVRNRNVVVGVTTGVDWKSIIGLAVLFIVLNAFVTATFSTVIARLQSRVFWVLPLLCVLYIYDSMQHKKNAALEG